MEFGDEEMTTGIRAVPPVSPFGGGGGVRTANGGITLVELLMVIAIIGTLAAILVPVAGIARDRSRSAVCVSNLREMHMGVILHAKDNEDRLPVGGAAPAHFVDGTRNAHWQQQIVPYLYPEATVQLGHDLARSQSHPPSLFLCPSATRHGAEIAHHGANIRVMPGSPAEQRRLGEFQPSVVLIADAHPAATPVIRPDTEASLYGAARSSGFHEGLAGRHRGRDNVLFVGGHVESFATGELPSAAEDPDREEALWGNLSME